MNRIRILLLVLLLPLFAAAPQYESQVVEKIDIIINMPGTEDADSSPLRGRMRTREGDLFSQTDFDNDLKNLAQEYDRVEPSIASVNGKLRLQLKVWPKPTIRTIVWNGNDKLEIAALQKELAIPICTVFDRLTFNKSFHKVKAYYVKKGYFEAQLDYNVTYDSCTNEVDITININEGRSGKIKEIVICGADSCQETELLEMMVTKEYSFFTSWYTGTGLYNEDAMQRDQYTMMNYFQNIGYADVDVKINIREADECDRIIIFIDIDRGELYRFDKVTFRGNTIFCSEDILPLFTFGPDAPFSPEQIRNTVTNITNLYGRRGYIDTNVIYEPRIVKDKCAYSLEMVIEEGDQFCVGLIKVFGNCSTLTKVILHETLLIPGEVFNIEKLQKTEQRLKNIGYFKNVNVYAVRSDNPCSLGGNYRDVHIEVEETTTGRFGAFAGFSTSEAFFGGFNLGESNFNSLGFCNYFRDGLAAFRGGGEYLQLTTSIGTKSRIYKLSWTKPYFMDTKWSVGFDMDKSQTRYISDDYDINAHGGNLRATYEINKFVRFGWHYRARDTSVTVSGKHQPESLYRAAKNAGFTSATGISLAYDSTDSFDKPTDGFRSILEMELAAYLFGDHTFWSMAYLNSYYVPVDKCSVLKFRWDFRFIDPFGATTYDNLPLDERIFMGGDNEVRGYRPYRIGPLFRAANGKENKDDPSGGISMQLLSIEYNRNLFKRVDGFLFCDSGQLNDQRWHVGRFHTSVGFGARVKLLDMLPQITLGMGFPINPESSSQVKKFFISFGARF